MKDYVLELTRAQTGANAKRNALREYLQAYLLRLGHDQGLFRQTAFIGGTALRFLYGLPRFSEDIELSVTKKKGFSFKPFAKKTSNALTLAGYRATTALKEEKTIQRLTVRFEDLLYEAGISPLRTEKLSIRIEVDTQPPRGARLETELVNRFFPIAFQTYDLPSLFSGKLTALLCRPYLKGRDLFDLGWYLSRWRDLVPNFPLLQNGLRQMGWTKTLPTQNNWRKILREVVAKVNWKQVRADVEPFLDRPTDMDIFTKENVIQLVG